MSLKLPEDFENGRRELQISENADAALESLKPVIKPEKLKEARVLVARMVSKTHSGPIPSAEELEHLESILPGSANRCFEMAEREQRHRHAMQTSIVGKEFSLRGRGQWLALAGLVLLLVVVSFLAYMGDTQAAAWLGGATIVGVVSIFATGKYIEEKSDKPEQDSSQGKAKPQPPAKKGQRRR